MYVGHGIKLVMESVGNIGIDMSELWQVLMDVQVNIKWVL